jgi:Ca2+-binding EF-hand superfamily protein
MKRSIGSLLLAIPFFVAFDSARAQELVIAHDPKKAFEEVDQNKDGFVDPAEYYERVNEVFYEADANRDGTLDPKELDAAVVIHTEFSSVDTNGDGKVTLIEFFGERARTFQQVDKNGDSELSEDEVTSAFTQGAKK